MKKKKDEGYQYFGMNAVFELSRVDFWLLAEAWIPNSDFRIGNGIARLPGITRFILIHVFMFSGFQSFLDDSRAENIMTTTLTENVFL